MRQVLALQNQDAVPLKHDKHSQMTFRFPLLHPPLAKAYVFLYHTWNFHMCIKLYKMSVWNCPGMASPTVCVDEH